MSPDRWVEVYYDEQAVRWHWRTVSSRGNLPDITVKSTGDGYRWKRGAKRAAKRENPGLPIMELPKS